MFGLLAASLLIGTGMAWGITRRLLGQLGGEPGQAAAVAKAVAGGDLTTFIQLKPGDSVSLMARLDEMQQALAGIVASVRQGSENVATASAESMRQQAQELVEAVAVFKLR